MKLIALILAVALTGCAAPVKPSIVVDTKYIVRPVPAEMTFMPLREPSADAQVTNDADLARWISGTETYIDELEAKFEALIEYVLKPIEK